MATATRRPADVPAFPEGLRPYPVTVPQFVKMIVAGVFPGEARVELLGGVLAEQMTKYAPHNFCVRWLAEALRGLAAPGWLVSEEKPVVLGRNWRPEPDIALVRGPQTLYRSDDPGADDLALLIEVAESTYPVDRGIKWHGYAAAKVPVYWIVNLRERTVEVYSGPSGRGKAARYRDVNVYTEADSVPVVVGGLDLGSIAVKDFLT